MFLWGSLCLCFKHLTYEWMNATPPIRKLWVPCTVEQALFTALRHEKTTERKGPGGGMREGSSEKKMELQPLPQSSAFWRFGLMESLENPGQLWSIWEISERLIPFNNYDSSPVPSAILLSLQLSEVQPLGRMSSCFVFDCRLFWLGIRNKV